LVPVKPTARCSARSLRQQALLRQQARYIFAGAARAAFVQPTGLTPRPSIHSCTEIGRTRAKSAPNCGDLDVVPGISIPGVVGGVAGCLLATAGAAILYKTWRVLAVKRGGRNRKDLVMLGGGKAAYLCRQADGRVDFVLLRAGGAVVAGAASTAAFIGFEVAMEVFQVCVCVCA
jgi:hypothetical protein